MWFGSEEDTDMVKKQLRSGLDPEQQQRSAVEEEDERLAEATAWQDASGDSVWFQGVTWAT